MSTIFVSYSHMDRKWFDPNYPYALIAWLENSLRRDGATLWYDRSDETGLQPGDQFERTILDAIDAAQFALLLVSEAFFASTFIQDVELPRILQRAEADGLVVIPILLEPCDWQSFKYVASRHMLPGRPTPLINFTSSDREWVYARDQVLSGIRRRLHRASPPPPSPATESLSPHVASPPQHAEALPIVQANFLHLVQGEGIMVGRERELETLATVWERARSGSAQAVLINGEAGIGKTRCIAEFLARAVGSECYILLSSATARPPSAPYQALREMLSPAVAQDAIPEIDEEFLAEVARTAPGLAARCPHLPMLADLPPDRARARLHWALTAYLLGLCGRAPVILFVDDLQWTDEPSLDFLLDFVIHQASAPLLVVASFRIEDQPNPTFIRRWRTELRGKSRLTEVNLIPWSEAETHRFITSWLGIPEAPVFSRRLQRAAEGNPMYLTEILRSLRQQGLLYRDETGAVSTPFDNATQDYEELPLPESISDLIKLRMDSLSADACAFLKAIAVIGNQFDPEIAQEVGELTTDQRDEALDELTAAQLVDAQDLVYGFRHNLHREAVYSALKPGERRKLHARAGQVLLDVVGPAPVLAEIQALADHFYRGENWAKALTYQLEAGLGALKLYDARTTRRYLQSARRLMERKVRQAPIQSQLTCLEGLGDAEALLGHFDEARNCYEAALERDPGSAPGQLHVKLADTFYRQTRFEEAAHRLQRALETLAVQPDQSIESRAHLLLGMIHVQKGEMAQALEETTQALTMENGLAHLLMAIVRREQGAFDLAITHCQRGIALAEAARDLTTLAKGHTNLGVLLMDAGRFNEARRTYERGLEMQAAIGDAYMHALTLCNLAETHRYLGDLDQSLRLARAGLDEFQQQKSAFGQALAHLNLGEALLEQGEPQKARAEHLEIARHLLEENDITDTLCEVLVVIAECHLAEGALADAEAVVGHTVEVADANECAGDRANGLRVLGLLRQRQGRHNEAEQVLRQSEEILRTQKQHYDLGRTRLAQAELHAADPARMAEAQSALEEAHAIFEASGAALQLKKAQELEAIL